MQNPQFYPQVDISSQNQFISSKFDLLGISLQNKFPIRSVSQLKNCTTLWLSGESWKSRLLSPAIFLSIFSNDDSPTTL
jgi:hypothetical protein